VPGSAMMFGTIAMVLILVSTALVFATSSGSMMWQFAMTVYREYAALKQKV
jgi:type IV secretory pathway TrbD component